MAMGGFQLRGGGFGVSRALFLTTRSSNTHVLFKLKAALTHS